MVHRFERYDRHLVCDGHRDDSSTGDGQSSAVSVKGHWWGARIRSDRRIDLRVRSFEESRAAIVNIDTREILSTGRCWNLSEALVTHLPPVTFIFPCFRCVHAA